MFGQRLCASINSGSVFLTDAAAWVQLYLASRNLLQRFTKITSWPHWSPETNFGLARAMTKTELRFQMAGTQDGKDRHPHPSATFIFIRNGFFHMSVITHLSNLD